MRPVRTSLEQQPLRRLCLKRPPPPRRKARATRCQQLSDSNRIFGSRSTMREIPAVESHKKLIRSLAKTLSSSTARAVTTGCAQRALQQIVRECSANFGARTSTARVLIEGAPPTSARTKLRHNLLISECDGFSLKERASSSQDFSLLCVRGIRLCNLLFTAIATGVSRGHRAGLPN